jgi:hypothetical protein
MTDRCIEVHSAMIYDRGGMKRLWQLVDVAEVKWTRNLDGISTGELTITGEACASQADALARIEPRRHELVLFRNGERVWEGPIVQVGWFRDRATLLAHDVLEYLKYTPLTRPWPNEDGGGPPLMLDRVAEIIPYELTTPYVMSVGTGAAVHDVHVPRWESLDPPINVLPYLEIRPGGVLTRSATEAFEYTLFEHLQNLSESGMDYTVIGRKILFWDKADPIGRTRTLTDNDFYGDIEVFATGSDHWSIQHVVGQPAEEDVDPSLPPEEAPDPNGDWQVTRANLFIDPRARGLNPAAWDDGDGGYSLTKITDADGSTWARSQKVTAGNGPNLLAVMDANVKYRLRATVRSSVALPDFRVGIRGQVDTTTQDPEAVSVPLPAGISEVDVTLDYSFALSNKPGFMFFWDAETNATLDIREVIIERAGLTTGLYFDGSTDSDEVIRYSWDGAEDASVSIQETNLAAEDTSLAVGNAGGEHPFYGVWTHITTTQNEEGTAAPTQEELNSQAGRGLVGRTPVPVEIRVPSGGGILPSHDLTIADLVPGVEVPVLATLNLRRISQMQRIVGVTVTETSESESVTVNMTPYGDVTSVTAFL